VAISNWASSSEILRSSNLFLSLFTLEVTMSSPSTQVGKMAQARDKATFDSVKMAEVIYGRYVQCT